MDLLDQTLDSNSQDKNESNNSDDGHQMQGDDGSVEDAVDGQATGIGSSGLLESGIQYPFRAENGAVTFRVVQLTQGDGTDGGAQVITTSAFPGQQGVPTVISSPFSNGGSPTGEGQGEARFTYFPAMAAASSDGSGDGTAAGLAGASTGQFYVMMSPQDVLGTGQRTIAPRTHQYSPKIDGTRTVRDERRRATHNEVERRRRDKINNWIIKLSKIVPDCSQDATKPGQSVSDVSRMFEQSKGGILAKTCDYIHELRTANQRLAESLKENERASVDAEVLRLQCEDLKSENDMLRAQLQQHGIVIAEMSSSP